MVLVVKNLLDNAIDVRDMGLISGQGRSSGGGHGNPFQYSCLENSWTEEPGGLQSMGLQRVGHAPPALDLWFPTVNSYIPFQIWCHIGTYIQ